MYKSKPKKQKIKSPNIKPVTHQVEKKEEAPINL